MIGIIDYGASNLANVQRAVAELGYSSTLVCTAHELKDTTAAILPGVGAFGPAMKKLENMTQALREYAADGKYILGICLGMQLMFEVGYEDGVHKGLGLLLGSVEKMEVQPLKIPHMGWNKLLEQNADKITTPAANGYAYFVHSYMAVPKDNEIVKLYSNYGVKVPAVVRKKNVVGMQFHPEKSGKTGMLLLRNFLEEATQRC